MTCALCTPGMGTAVLSHELLGISAMLFVVLLWPRPPSSPPSSHLITFSDVCVPAPVLRCSCGATFQRNVLWSPAESITAFAYVNWSALLGLHTHGCVSIYQPLCCSDLFTHPSPGRDCVFLKGPDKDEYAFVLPGHRLCNRSQGIFVEWIINTRQVRTSCSWVSNS